MNIFDRPTPGMQLCPTDSAISDKIRERTSPHLGNLLLILLSLGVVRQPEMEWILWMQDGDPYPDKTTPPPFNTRWLKPGDILEADDLFVNSADRKRNVLPYMVGEAVATNWTFCRPAGLCQPRTTIRRRHQATGGFRKGRPCRRGI